MEKVPGSAHVNLSLGGLVLVGGAMGYVHKGSKASLIAGVAMGSLLLGSGYLIAKTENIFQGHALGAVTSGVMAAAMGKRYLV
jgi:uncharacterized membrane protein (UPF0136 family)